MSQLLIDLGNTRIKWTLRDGQEIAEVQALAHADPVWPTEFTRRMSAMPTPNRIALAAVAPDLVVAALLRALNGIWPEVSIARALSQAQLARFRSAYAQPERMGVDRFLAAAAASEHAKPIVVVGCGTALTVDVIEASGQHLGGLIAPAPETMRAAVLSRTARVHWLREGRALDFGANTEDALEGGVWMAAAGMIERALRKATARLGTAPALVAHGGSAPALAEMLDFALPMDPILVMKGLAMWLDTQK